MRKHILAVLIEVLQLFMEPEQTETIDAIS
jgi:hypothetical protein